MKAQHPFLLLLVLAIQLTTAAQNQWYQSQDGQLQPNGTYATGILSLTRNSFVAAYMWRLENEQYTWKISKSHTNGTEQRTFFLTAPYGIVEMKAGYRNTVYVLVRSFPFAQDPQYTIYKLDSNLVVKAQKTLSFPGSYTVFNLNVFELDEQGNLYLAGDGQYPDGFGYGQASFLLKADKNLLTRWTRMDSTQTSYARLHIEKSGTIRLIEDFYTFFPDIKVQQISANGQLQQRRTYTTDAGRQSLTTLLDNDDNLLLAGTTDNGAGQTLYLHKIARRTGQVVYRKNYLNATAANLDDVKLDEDGQLYALLTQYNNSGSQCRLARIQPRSGALSWSRSFAFAQDSCQLRSIVLTDEEMIWLLGEKRSGQYYSKGLAVQVKRNGQRGDAFISPDSVAFARSHTLFQGISAAQEGLIAIGNTNDLDTLTGSSSYFRAFALGNTKRRHGHGCGQDDRSLALAETVAANPLLPELAKAEVISKPMVYPNPATDRITVRLPDAVVYDQVQIYDMQGHLQATQRSTGNTANFDLSRFASGMYMMVFRTAAGVTETPVRFTVRR